MFHPVCVCVCVCVCVFLCVDHYVVTDDGACVRSCRAGTLEVKENGVQHCKKCDGPCPKGRETRRGSLSASHIHIRHNLYLILKNGKNTEKLKYTFPLLTTIITVVE